MVTFLDLLVVVVMVLAAVSLVAVALMFLVPNEKVRKVCLWLVAGLGVYMGYVGVRINRLGFPPQTILAALLAAAAMAAIVVERKSPRAARILASAALLAGMCNAFL